MKNRINLSRRSTDHNLSGVFHSRAHKKTIISCSGPTDSPHPRVYLTPPKEGNLVCPYCHRIVSESASVSDF